MERNGKGRRKQGLYGRSMPRPIGWHNFFRCGKYFCQELQVLYGRGMPRPISLRNFSRCGKYFLL